MNFFFSNRLLRSPLVKNLKNIEARKEIEAPAKRLVLFVGKFEIGKIEFSIFKLFFLFVCYFRKLFFNSNLHFINKIFER